MIVILLLRKSKNCLKQNKNICFLTISMVGASFQRQSTFLQQWSLKKTMPDSESDSNSLDFAQNVSVFLDWIALVLFSPLRFH